MRGADMGYANVKPVGIDKVKPPVVSRSKAFLP